MITLVKAMIMTTTITTKRKGITIITLVKAMVTTTMTITQREGR